MFKRALPVMPPKLEMPECLRTQLSTKPQRIEVSCRGERRFATWGLRRACRPEHRGSGPAPPGGGCEGADVPLLYLLGRRRAPVAVYQLRTQLSTYSLRLRLGIVQ